MCVYCQTKGENGVPLCIDDIRSLEKVEKTTVY